MYFVNIWRICCGTNYIYFIIPYLTFNLVESHHHLLLIHGHALSCELLLLFQVPLVLTSACHSEAIWLSMISLTSIRGSRESFCSLFIALFKDVFRLANENSRGPCKFTSISIWRPSSTCPWPHIVKHLPRYNLWLLMQVPRRVSILRPSPPQRSSFLLCAISSFIKHPWLIFFIFLHFDHRHRLELLMSLSQNLSKDGTSFVLRRSTLIDWRPQLISLLQATFILVLLIWIILLSSDKGIHSIWSNILLIVSLELLYIRMLFKALDLPTCRIIEVANIVFLNLQLLKLPFDLWQIHICFYF